MNVSFFLKLAYIKLSGSVLSCVIELYCIYTVLFCVLVLHCIILQFKQNFRPSMEPILPNIKHPKSPVLVSSLTNGNSSYPSVPSLNPVQSLTTRQTPDLEYVKQIYHSVLWESFLAVLP